MLQGITPGNFAGHRISEDAMKISNLLPMLRSRLEALHSDQQAIAATEYVIIFALVSLGATVSLLATAAYVKAYRDFMVWWLAHPAV